MDTKKLVAGTVASLILTGGLGTAVFAHADTTASPTPAASSSAQPAQNGQQAQNGHKGQQAGEHRGGGKGQGMGNGGGFGIMNDETAKAVATKLGIDQTKLTDAAKAVFEDLRAQHKATKGTSATPGTQQTRPDRTAMEDEFASALATKLGVDNDALKSALDEARTAEQASHKAEARTGLKTRLDKAVTDGKISQADEDSILKGFDAGVLGGGHR